MFLTFNDVFMQFLDVDALFLGIETRQYCYTTYQGHHALLPEKE
jgi:hypothetical protein